ncbi:MAG: DUF3293 domain-containing protein [Lysobacter sp.]|nr:DUF3293 domain-containing protein [Lysobacter sp.]
MPSSTPYTGEARIAELVRAYLAAEYRWEMDGDWLNLRIGERAPDAARRFPHATQFGLLSAWNPHSVERPEAANRAADDTLQQDLLGCGRRFQPAFSSAVNRSWREPSWLVVDLPLSGFDTLSRRYGQLATLHWTALDAVRLRVDATRPREFAHHADIDWLRG